MLDGVLDRIRDLFTQASANDWIAAIVIGALIQIVVLLVFRVLGFFLRLASWLLALAAGVAAGLYVLHHGGVPTSLGGEHIDRWIEDARRWIGV